MRVVLAIFLTCLSLYGVKWPAADFNDTTNKVKVECSEVFKNKKVMVVLAFGQSNASNRITEQFHAKNNSVYNYYDGNCYKADGPLLGNDGVGGSVWTIFGDLIVGSRLYDAVLIKSVAMGSSSVENWMPGHILFPRLLNAKSDLDRKHIKITHMLWHQGEVDALYKTSKEQYKMEFMRMLRGVRRMGIYAPIYIAQASVIAGYDNGAEQIRSAQFELASENFDIFFGPNTDFIIAKEDRQDDRVHFSYVGAVKHAQGWLYSVQIQDSKRWFAEMVAYLKTLFGL